MFEVTGRDGPARRARWELPGGDVATPAAVHPATARHEPPEWAKLVVARDDPGRRPWLLDAGSAFDPVEVEAEPDATIPPGLSYPTEVDDAVHARANDFNQDVGGDRIGLVSPGDPRDVPGAECLVAPGIGPLLDRPRRLADRLVGLRELAYQRALHLPGVGRAPDLALLVYAGVDLVDAAPAILDARAGRFWTPEQVLDGDEAARRTCPCPACLGDAEGVTWLADHNRWVQRTELSRIDQAIAEGRLRELVETRVHARPHAVAVLRHLDRDHHRFLAERTPVHRDRRMLCSTSASLHRPEVVRYRQRLLDGYSPPASASVLLILPCSAYKPYAESRTHRRLRQALRGLENRWTVHECMLTSPLGVVPRELERTYPAAEYDLPVSGHWDLAEQQIIGDALSTVLARGGYDHVVAHLHEDEAAIVADVVDKVEVTTEGDPRSDASLERLREALGAVTPVADRVDYDTRLRQELSAIATFQFGPAGTALVEAATTEGSWPQIRLFDGDDQVATLVASRGRYTLAMEGGRRLLAAGTHRVAIEDFVPSGSVFAVGVEEADPGIRIEDDVVVHHEGEVRAVGRATMPGPEMVASDRGAAVEVKHHA